MYALRHKKMLLLVVLNSSSTQKTASLKRRKINHITSSKKEKSTILAHTGSLKMVLESLPPWPFSADIWLKCHSQPHGILDVTNPKTGNKIDINNFTSINETVQNDICNCVEKLLLSKHKQKTLAPDKSIQTIVDEKSAAFKLEQYGELLANTEKQKFCQYMFTGVHTSTISFSIPGGLLCTKGMCLKNKSKKR